MIDQLIITELNYHNLPQIYHLFDAENLGSGLYGSGDLHERERGVGSADRCVGTGCDFDVDDDSSAAASAGTCWNQGKEGKEGKEGKPMGLVGLMIISMLNRSQVGLSAASLLGSR